MAKRFSTADKGKAIAVNPSIAPRIRIRAPDFDPSELIRENMFTIVRNIGLELGELETYVVTRSSARVRVIVDGLKPLVMEPTLDFDTGEESVISLEYERLGNHCSTCFRLSHLQSQCPDRAFITEDQSVPPSHSSRYMDTIADTRSTSREIRAPTVSHGRPFQQRVDRYGRPFGDRISTATNRPSGPRNKIVPMRNLALQNTGRGEQVRPPGLRDQDHELPLDSRRRLDNRGEENNVLKRQSPTLQWRIKSPTAGLEATSQRRQSLSPAVLVSLDNSSTHGVTIAAPEVEEENIGTIPIRRRGRPARGSIVSSSSRNNIRLSPKTYAGMGSKKRKLAQLHIGSPGPSSRGTTRSSRSRRQTSSNPAPPTWPSAFVPGGGGFLSIFFAGLCLREAVASSAPRSPVLFPGGGGSLSTASAGWRRLLFEKFVDPSSDESRSDDDVAVSRRIVDSGAEGRRL
ncbi:hypothetical protein YC2023_123756 [Brassica napus]